MGGKSNTNTKTQFYHGISALSGSFDTTETRKKAKKASIQPTNTIKASPVYTVGAAKVQPVKRPVQAAESKKPNYGKTAGIRQYIR